MSQPTNQPNPNTNQTKLKPNQTKTKPNEIASDDEVPVLYLWGVFKRKVKLATIVKDDPKVPFSIATTP